MYLALFLPVGLCFDLGVDFILVGGGIQDDDTTTAGSFLIALDATAEQSSTCTPPGNMINPRNGHMLGMSGGNLVACGGFSQPTKIDSCEEFNTFQQDWTQATNALEEKKGNFPSVQLDDNRIWMGRKLAV